MSPMPRTPQRGTNASASKKNGNTVSNRTFPPSFPSPEAQCACFFPNMKETRVRTPSSISGSRTSFRSPRISKSKSASSPGPTKSNCATPTATACASEPREHDETETSPKRHAPHRPPSPRPFLRRPVELAETPKRIRLLLLRSRLARPNHALRRHKLHSRKHPASSHGLASRRPRPRKIHPLRPIPSPRTRRTPRPPLHDHPPKLARTRPHLQRTNRKPERPRPRHLRLPRLSATPIRRHRNVRRTQARPARPGRRRPSPSRRTDPRSSSPLQREFWAPDLAKPFS